MNQIDNHVGSVIGGVFGFMILAVVLVNAEKISQIIDAFYKSNTSLLKTGMGR